EGQGRAQAEVRPGDRSRSAGARQGAANQSRLRRRHGLREPPGTRTRRPGRHQGRVRPAGQNRRRLGPESAGKEEGEGREEEQDRRHYRRRSKREVNTLSLNTPRGAGPIGPAPPSFFGVPCYNRSNVPSESTSLSESAPVPPLSATVPPLAYPVEQLYAELEAKIREYRPKDDLAALQQAFRFASKYHEGQTRDSGEPYMAHPVMVAHILADMRMDVVAMETGLLHDVVEDTSVTVEQVRKEFGPEVARCVDGVTKLTKLDVFSAEDRQAESVRKMLLAMVEDIRVILVKLADRIHNMRTLGYLSPERRERIARETIEIYAPIAHRLGMGKVRGELEDLAFQHLEPDAYQEILGAIESKRHSNEEFLTEIRQTVESELRREGIPARIDGRLKRPYSVFQKLRRQKIS